MSMTKTVRGKPAQLPPGHAQNIYLTNDIRGWLQRKAAQSFISLSAQARIELHAAMQADAAQEAAHA